MADHRWTQLICEVDLRTHENNSRHRTRDIDRERLIVRRGQPFSIALQCSDTLPPKHQLQLVVHLGKGDQFELKVQQDRGNGQVWWFNHQVVQDEILLTLQSPADAVIGQYYLAILIISPDGRTVEKTNSIHFHLLFNPWCKDDVVYLSDDSLLQEYVMNEDGIIYVGSWDHISDVHWNYGQFEDRVMDICFQILNNSNEFLKNPQMDIERRSDPVYVSRIISAMINSNDDRGVLTGRWQGPYSDGVTPTRWAGSVPILRWWSKDGAKAVKYGQCWVFAAVACTVLRCLGVPTRVITNFNSAHDVDGNLSIDSLYNEELESMDSSGRQDSTWNFHCWVESWMRRDDLPKGNDGWQVLDPTPQELSDGKFCCGPCPVTAIKEGNLAAKYDAPFIFAEVNADIISWIVKRNGQRQKIRVDDQSIGRNISTKSVYGDQREDVTLHYKYPEGSEEEREVYRKAGRSITHATNDKGEPKLMLQIKHAKPVFGTDFDVIIEVKNEGGADVCADLVVLAKTITYTSVHQGMCKREAFSIRVPAHQEVVRLHYDDYVSCVSEHRLIGIKAFLEFRGEEMPIMSTANIPLSTPQLSVQVPGKVFVNEQVSATICFTNPLPVPLKGGVFTVSGLLPPTEIHEVAPGQKVCVKLPLVPRRTGVKKLLVDFDSDMLKDVKGVATVIVRKKYKPTFMRFY
uniref:protein-glutamine gamma-glutamyltransferase n=1 Tax=Sphaeramia orbicularis TaxID=375764 RepID=A0A672YBQ1_9TELE